MKNPFEKALGGKAKHRAIKAVKNLESLRNKKTGDRL